MILSLDVQRNKSLMAETHVVVDTADKGITQQFQINDGTPLYDLTGCTLEFRVQSPGGVVTGQGNAINDATKGLFTATWPQSLYDHSMDSYDAVFLIKKDDTVVDTTSRFWLTVQATPGVIETIGRSAVDGVEESLGMLSQAVTQAQKIVTDANGLTAGVSTTVQNKLADLDKQVATASTTIDTSIKSIQDASTKKLTDAQNAIDTQLAGITGDAKTSADAVAKLLTDTQTTASTKLAAIDTAKTDALTKLETDKQTALAGIVKDGSDGATAAVKAINDAYAAKVADITKDWQAQLDTLKGSLTTQMASLTAAMAKANDTDIPAIQKALKDAQDASAKVATQLADSISTISDADGTALTVTNRGVKLPAYLLSSDAATTYATKTELAAGGKVQTATINGGTVIQPDSKGNLPINFTMPDLTPYAKQTDVDTAIKAIPKPDMSLYAQKTDVATAITAAKPDLTPYATTTAMQTAITAAKPDLTPYATTKALNDAIAAIPKPDMSLYALKTDLAAYSTTTQMTAMVNTAITAFGSGDAIKAAIQTILNTLGVVTTSNFDQLAWTWKDKAFVVLTQAQFNALTTVDKRVNYIIIPG